MTTGLTTMDIQVFDTTSGQQVGQTLTYADDIGYVQDFDGDTALLTAYNYDPTTGVSNVQRRTRMQPRAAR